MQQKGDAILNLGLLVLGAAAAYGIKQGVAEVVYMSTILIFGLVLYVLSVYRVILSLGGYKKFLEWRIRYHVPDEPLLWETRVTGSHVHKLPVSAYTWIVPGTISLISASVSLHYAYAIDHSQCNIFVFKNLIIGHSLLSPILAVLYIILGLLCMHSLIHASRAFDGAYDVARKAFNDETENPHEHAANAPLGISIALVACIPFALLVFLVSKRKGKQS